MQLVFLDLIQDFLYGREALGDSSFPPTKIFGYPIFLGGCVCAHVG